MVRLCGVGRMHDLRASAVFRANRLSRHLHSFSANQMSTTKLSKAEDFPYRLHINPSRYFSIIRFPNEAHILNHLTLFRTTLPAHEFFSLTSTHAEISVIQNAKHALYPQALGQDLARLLQIQTGFVLIQVVPDTGSQIDFGSSSSRLFAEV
jgi:hypothetical protein